MALALLSVIAWSGRACQRTGHCGLHLTSRLRPTDPPLIGHQPLELLTGVLAAAIGMMQQLSMIARTSGEPLL
jgi:hypothetical protein